MKIIRINDNYHRYSPRVYYILGDINTLVDVGSDPNIVSIINKYDMDVRKKRVDQVILTQFQSDQIAVLSAIRKAFNPRVFAFSPLVEGVDQVVENGDRLCIGHHTYRIIHTSDSFSDSISLYCEEDDSVFVGKAATVIRAAGGGYEEHFGGAEEASPVLRRCERIEANL